ncbi:MAG: DUF3177 family protein [Kaiparowitsia implicata GSE-PSE-MK54-09C]|jgi:hypothetical protein|nr:DUF3177 family protein [Kaiparowitsia implicata GSE-PSE-MK54-09C]
MNLVIEESLLRSLVWLDYRLAVLFLVILPLLLLLWATVSRSESIQRVLIIYWRVSSLLAITVYLMIGNLPIGFLSSFLARVLIPISLWFWVDLNEEIDDLRQSTLKLAFNAWRWAVTAYSVVGAIAFIPVLQCSFNQGLYTTPFCQVWREAPLMYRDTLHAGYTLGFLGFWGIVGLVIYLLYLVYYALVRFGKNGRSAMEQ